MTRWFIKTVGLLHLFIIPIAVPTLAHSADIQRVDHGKCTLTLEGEIVAGDAQRFWEIYPNYGDVLCLNSPGGSFSEAIRIAERLNGGGIATLLEEGSECLSACALIFVAASRFEENFIPIRSMHQNARLGFHAPYVIPPKGSYTEQTIAEAFKVGTQSVTLMMSLGIADWHFGGRGIFPQDILIEILGKGPDEFYEIDRPERARALGIEVFGSAPVQWNQAQVCTACDHWFDNSRYPNDCTQVQTIFHPSGVTEYRVAGYEAEALAQCVVRVEPDRSTAIIRTDGLWEGDLLADSTFQELAPWYASAKTGPED